MKKNTILVFLIFLAFACKKKDAPEPTPEPTPPPPVVHQIYVKVNGVEKFCDQLCFSSSSSGGLKGSYFYISGVDESIYIGYDKILTTGKHNLVKYGKPNVVYFKNNVQFHAVSGTLNVASIDTSQSGTMKQFVATLDFKTDTVGSTSSFYNITEGSINIKF